MRVSSYNKVPLQIVGQSYEHRSTAVSIQKTMNLIPQAEVTGAANSSLTSWPGLRLFANGSGVDRGATVFKGVMYKVTDNTLYSVSSDAAVTSIGTIDGANRCVFANDGTNLIITTGGTGYQLSGSTLTEITDPDFQSGNSCAYLNQRVIYDGDGGKFQWSEVGDPDSIAPTNFATGESAPDDTIRVFAWREQLYLFGTATIETWYNSTSGTTPFLRVQNATMQVGLGAVHSVVSTDEFVYFLGDDRRVYRFSATQPQNITTIAISHQLDKLGDLSGAVADIVRIEGQSFYILTVQGKTFAYNEEAGAWFNLSTTANETAYKANSFVEAYGKRLCTVNGAVLELDLNTYDNAGEVIINERIFGPVTSRDLGLGNSRALMSRLWLEIEAGVGLASGQGDNPQLMVSASFDGGKSFTNESDVLMGRTGEGRIDVKFDHCESFRSMFVKIRCSDPVFFSLFAATLEVKAGGI